MTPVVQTVTPIVQAVAPVTRAVTPVVQNVTQAVTPIVQAVAPVTQAVAPVVQTVTKAAGPVAQAIAPVTQAPVPATTAKTRAGASAPTTGTGAGAGGVAPKAEPVPVPSPSTAPATTATPSHSEAPAGGTVAPNGTDANSPQPTLTGPATRPERYPAPVAGAHRLAPMNESAYPATVTELSSPGLVGVGAAPRASRGLHRATSTKNHAPSNPAPLAPFGAVSGNGGDSASSGVAGGSSGAAELYSHTLAGGPSATLALRTGAQRRVAAPFLLLLERPG